jgi:hydrogenase small subunit
MITRRQFLQYCITSAAALGLTQADILKLKEALAAQTACNVPTLPVIWLTGQACSGCVTSILNRVISVDGNYYDGDMLNALYGAGIPTAHPNDPLGELNAVADVGDLLVGDAVGADLALAGVPRNTWRWFAAGDPTSVPWADDLGGVGQIPNPNPFPNGFITNTWNTTVMASTGELEVPYLNSIVNSGDPFVLVVEGAIPQKWDGKGCLVFDNYPDPLNPAKGIIKNLPGSANNPSVTWGPADGIRSVTMWEALIWIASKAHAVICYGTCSSFGGIPAAKGNKTLATSVTTILNNQGIATPVVNCPGCAPNPDWMIYPVAYFLIHSALPTLDTDKRPIATYSNPLCANCTNGPAPTPNGPNAATELGDKGCLMKFGCKGSQVHADCSSRMWNRFDDGTKNNWCVGAQAGANPGATLGICDARHPCQGCVDNSFPDGMSPFYGIMDKQ